MLNTLGWRLLEQRRADTRLILFYKIVYGHVEISTPAYIHDPVKMTRAMHSKHDDDALPVHTNPHYSKLL